MVRGASFQNGIIYIGKKHVACSYQKNGRMNTWLKPLTPKTMLHVGKLVYLSMPWWFHLLLVTWIFLIFLPEIFAVFGVSGVPGLPLFSLIYFFYGTHFWFPKELKKYHGAEHKVFSYKQVITARNRVEINKASITNKYCSTNAVMLYFMLVALFVSLYSLTLSIGALQAIEWATYTSIFITPFATFWLNRTKTTSIHRWLFGISYWLQRYVTTLEPEDIHIRTSIRAYRRLALKEFPEKLHVRKKKRKVKRMAIADVTIMPLGSDTTSVSEVVAEVHKKLAETNLAIKYELTPMSTIIEGEIEDLFEILKVIQEVPFSLGHQRVATNIRIDDRRDQLSSMKAKLTSVQEKLTDEQNK